MNGWRDEGTELVEGGCTVPLDDRNSNENVDFPETFKDPYEQFEK